MFASLVLGQKSLKNTGLKGSKLLPCPPHYQPARAPTRLGPSLHAENDSDRIFNIMGEGSDPSESK